jgi:hypothetical protein
VQDNSKFVAGLPAPTHHFKPIAKQQHIAYFEGFAAFAVEDSIISNGEVSGTPVSCAGTKQ